MERSSIQLSKEIRDKLKELGKMGDSYEDVIKKLIVFYKDNKER